MRRSLAIAAVVILALGCSSEMAAPGVDVANNPDQIVPVSQDGGSACARPEQGCSCDAGAGPITCYGEPVAQPSGVVCNEGAMYCRDGYWSSCETIRTYTLDPAAAALIDGPTACNPCNPDCSVSHDYPTTGDLTPSNSTSVVYDPSAGGITLTSLGGTGGALTDTDGDGVPDIADDYPTDPSRWIAGGGFYHTLPYGGAAAIDPLNFNVQVTTADVYFLMDTTGSMGGEISNLRSTITSGTFIPGCPGGVIGAIRCTIPDAWFGVGSHDDYPASGCVSRCAWRTVCGWWSCWRVYRCGNICSTYGSAGSGDLPYIHRLDITSSVAAAQTAVNGLGLHYGADWPESQTQALYAVATGNAIPFVAPRGGCGGGRWGYPCFRPGTIPIVILFTDAPYHNGPNIAYDYGLAGAIPWSTAVSALVTRGIKLIVVNSGGSGEPRNDALAITNATGSVDGTGAPYVFNISSSGSGLGPAVVNAVVNLANYSRYDVSARATDNPATPGFDERTFVNAIRAVSFPAGRCTGISGGSVFTQCLPGTSVNFSVTFKNDVVMPTIVPQVFNFSIQVLLNGTTVQATIPVRIVVPAAVPTFPPSGSYHRDYDSTVRCMIPPDRPDWGSFTWTASTPGSSNIRFEIRTADTLAALSTATPVNIPVPPSLSPQDIGALLTPGAGNFHPYLRVTAVLNSSPDHTVAPTLTGFTLQYTCAPAE